VSEHALSDQGIERAALAIANTPSWEALTPAPSLDAVQYRTGIAAVYRLQARRALAAYFDGAP
jgi:hypothetical protein